MSADEPYLLLCDVVRSTRKSRADADEVRDTIMGRLRVLNRKHARQLTHRLALNYGDEVAGIFRTPDGLYDVVDDLRHALRGLATFRFVVSVGRLGADTRDLTQVGGPIFKRANAAIEAIKASKQFCKWLLPDHDAAATLEALTELIHAIQQDMTDYQYEVFRLLADGHSNAEIAEQLGKHPPSVSNANHTGHANAVIAGETAIRRCLSALPR